MPAKQTITVKTTRTKTRTKRNKNKSKRGNPKRCPTCGRFM